MKAVPPDHKERSRIETELDRNVLVDAGAGSGKTESLSRRMVSGLIEGLYQVDRMAAVTFTRKAACELRGRLHLVLEEAATSHEDPERRRRARSALSSLDTMFVGTIHSFCARLLREFPVEVGVSPGFREMDTVAQEQMRTDIFQQLLKECPKTHPGTLRALSESNIRPSDLLGALKTICANSDVQYPSPEHPRPATEPVWEAIDRFATALTELLPRPIPPETTCGVQERGSLFLRRVRYADRGSMFGLVHCLEAWQGAFKVTYLYWPGNNLKERKEAASEVLELVEAFVEDTVAPFMRNWRAHLYGLCVSLLVDVRERYAQERRRTAQLDFGDLLSLAAAALRDNLDLRRALSDKFRWLFVDEFQDTDPVQSEVILLLAADESYDGTDWTQAPLRRGSLFVVGDPKQSIYRFRRADIDTYTFVKERIENTGGLVLSLTASFRSLPALCDWNNRVFSELFPPVAVPGQAHFSGLEPVRTPDDGTFTGVFTLTDDTRKYTEVAANEAHRLAHLIASAVSEGRNRWGDFLILTMRREDVAHYARHLEELRVPVETTGGKPEASTWRGALQELLCVLGDPQDEAATVGVLRGLLYGLSDEELYRHRQASGSFSLLRASNGRGYEPVVGALQELHRMYRWTRELPAAAAVERIIDETGILALAAAANPGEGEVPALMQLADQIRLASLEGRSLSQALSELPLQDTPRPVSLNTGRHDVVRVMNLHQAKGLQAPVVFLAAPTGGFPDDTPHRIVREGGRALGYLTIGNRYRTFAEPYDWEDHVAAEQDYRQQEALRLLYVAATRARDVLVVSRWSGSHAKAKRPWQPFDQFLAEAPELPWTAGEVTHEPARFSIETANQAYLERTALWSECRQPSWSRAGVAGHNLAPGRTLQLAETPVPEAVTSGERKDAGAAWGSLIHRLLEHAVRQPDIGPDRLTQLAHWFVFDHPELVEVVPLAVDAVFEVMKTDLWNKVMKAGARLVEVPFGVGVENRLVFGVLDLALHGEGGWELVDYKTDRKAMDDLVQTYADQVEEYARHWVAAAGEPVAYAGLFGVREGQLSADVRRASFHE